ncbi:MAG: hypothetical protein AAF748_11215 [Pseudomonadota bacterium]
MGEVAVGALFCMLLNGAPEAQHDYGNLGGLNTISVDCETPTHVIEIGLDNTDGLRDSLHQAAFAAALTDKRPMVLVIDTDGVEDRYQYELRVVARKFDVAFGVCSADFIHRWVATAPFRSAGLDNTLNDLPVKAVAERHCDLANEFARAP